MLTYTITTSLYSTWWISQSNHTWTVGADALIQTGSQYAEDYSAIFETSQMVNNRIVVNGTVISQGNSTHDDAGISASGTSTDVIVHAGGTIKGEFGVWLHGVDQSLTNAGKITGIHSGIDVLHEALIKNAGVISAAESGISTEAEAIQILNEEDAIVAGNINGMTILAAQGQESRIVNYGLIKGTMYSLDSASGNETVVNHGRMVGDVDLGDGTDVFDNRGGTVKGEILGGLGNDTLLVNTESTRLTEGVGSGYDTVKSSVTYTLDANVENLVLFGGQDIAARGNAMANRLEGNSGDNRIYGKAGADTIDGHKGNDMLFGGTSADTFVFSTGSGKDRIADFETGVDTIDLSEIVGITSFADLKAHHLQADGDDLIIHAGQDRIAIHDMTRAELHAGDFAFAL